MSLFLILKNTLIISFFATFFQYFIAFVLVYKNKITPFWWVIPTSTGVILFKIFIYKTTNSFFDFAMIIILSIFFGIPFAYFNISKNIEKTIKEEASISCNKLESFLLIEVPIIFSNSKKIITFSFLATWYKTNVIIPFNNGGLNFSTSNFDTYIYYNYLKDLNLNEAFYFSSISFFLSIFFSLVFYGGLNFVDNNNYLHKFFFFFNNINIRNVFRREI